MYLLGRSQRAEQCVRAASFSIESQRATEKDRDNKLFFLSQLPKPMDPATVKRAVAALLKHVENVSNSQKDSLLEPSQIVQLIIGLKKIPETGRVKARRV